MAKKGAHTMRTYEHTSNAKQQDSATPTWFTQPGPTPSFAQTAPRHLLQDNRETAPAIHTDPSWFTQVGPTRDFVASR